jgi:multiple sugar transport system permease protein
MMSRKKVLSMEKKLAIKGYMFILPATIFFVFFTLIPMLSAIYLSFTDYDGVSRLNFIFFDNYRLIFRNDMLFFPKSFLNVVGYFLMAVPLSIVVPLIYALLINQEKKGMKFFRAIYYIPGLTSAIAAAAVFRLVFNPSIGIINSFLALFGITGLKWLESPDTAMFSIVILVIWMSTGGNMIIFSAALKSLPMEVFEAAKIDGASPLQSFFRITLPLISPTIYFITTMAIIGAFQLYDQVLMLTNGGPANSTVTPVFVIYNRAFGLNSNMGYASAQAVILFVFIAFITLLMQRLMKSRTYQG